MLGLASGVGSLARFLGPIVMGFLYDLARARGAFYAGALLTAAAFVVALRMRRYPLLSDAAPEPSVLVAPG
jgi:MFS family permease